MAGVEYGWDKELNASPASMCCPTNGQKDLQSFGSVRRAGIHSSLHCVGDFPNM